jgi:isopentenyl-diphosphate delta-isomerase
MEFAVAGISASATVKRATAGADALGQAARADTVVLVDAADNDIGKADKLSAHQSGLMHRAISVFVFDGSGRMLVQRRAAGKYHCAGFWANACCSHPYPGEAPKAAAQRRCREELGLDIDVNPAGRIHYRADVGSGLIEDELVHLYWGVAKAPCDLNPDEVAAVQFIDTHALLEAGHTGLLPLAPWFVIYMRELAPRIAHWSEMARASSAA